MDLKEILTTHREYLHQIPELGFCEFKTSAYLKEQLELLRPRSLELVSFSFLFRDILL